MPETQMMVAPPEADWYAVALTLGVKLYTCQISQNCGEWEGSVRRHRRPRVRPMMRAVATPRPMSQRGTTKPDCGGGWGVFMGWGNHFTLRPILK